MLKQEKPIAPKTWFRGMRIQAVAKWQLDLSAPNKLFLEISESSILIAQAASRHKLVVKANCPTISNT